MRRISWKSSACYWWKRRHLCRQSTCYVQGGDRRTEEVLTNSSKARVGQRRKWTEDVTLDYRLCSSARLPITHSASANAAGKLQSIKMCKTKKKSSEYIYQYYGYISQSYLHQHYTDIFHGTSVHVSSV